jgi:hypothetical protein
MIVVWGLFCRISGKIVPKQRSLVVQAGVRPAFRLLVGDHEALARIESIQLSRKLVISSVLGW